MLHAFALQLKRGHELQLLGDLTLIRLQWIVHQRARLLGIVLFVWRPRTTSVASFGIRRSEARLLGLVITGGYGTLLGLLREVDAWITSGLQDLPDSPLYTVIPLWDGPGELVVNPYHPFRFEPFPFVDPA